MADRAAGIPDDVPAAVNRNSAGLCNRLQPQPLQAAVRNPDQHAPGAATVGARFYLLLAFSPQHAFGAWLERWLHVQLAFSFAGLVLASMLFSLPFMVQPLQAGFQHLPVALIEASRTLGKPDHVTLWRVLLPNMKGAVLTAAVLSFAHTVGEFGVVLMIGGNIPGVTRVASIAVYDQVESLQYAAAHRYAAVLLLLSFATLLLVYVLNRRWRQADS